MDRVSRLFLDTRHRGARQTDVLDGIRGVAVLFVLFSHLGNKELTLLPISFAGNASGQIGVYLFFALSAFLLSSDLFAKLEAGQLNGRAWRHYALRRVARIYPFYLTALAFTVLATQWGWEVFDPMNWGDAITHLLLLEGKQHFWTIACEVQFYLLLPLVVLGVATLARRGATGVFFGVGAAMLCSTELTLLFGLEDGNVLRHLPIFLGGVLGAWLCRLSTFREYAHARPRLSRAVLLDTFLLLLFLMPNIVGRVTGPLFGIQLPWTYPLLYPGWAVLVTGLIMAAVLVERSWFKNLLESAPLRIIGAMSFSLYINHWFVLEWVSQSALGHYQQIACFWGGSLFVSAATYLLIERPLSRVRCS